ncbi:MAG TPA: hypothetical protein V6C84_16170 [Coleofasciculaceae cyanobacterium]|jgi:hypothetical protein
MKSSLTPEEYARKIYQDFCEGDGSQCYAALQNAWDKYQAMHGEIENGDETDRLVFAAIHSAIQAMFVDLQDKQST